MLKPEEILHKEKLCLLLHMKRRKDSFSAINSNVPGKNAEMSIRLRKEGNALYTRGPRDREEYIRVWNLYTESIIFAPNNSEELALAHGNKSAFLLHLCSFDNCIKECDQALSITSCNYLKVKLLYRKAKSLYMLNKSPKEVCDEALQLLEKLTLDKKIKSDYKRKLTELHGSSISVSDKCKMCYEKHDSCNDNEFLNFERSQEVPCASKSVAIQYNKKWRRHIVATEDIQPGEIIGVENYCLNFPRGQSKHQFCGNCMNYLVMYSIIPCEYCTYNVYCTESCRKEAWEKYHQFECSILILLNFNETLLNNILHPLRMCLLGVYQVGGGLQQMKNQLLEIENAEDPRKKGFSNGIFEEDKVKSILSLHYCTEHLDIKYKLSFMENSCLAAYLLAKYTNFFGEKMNLTESEMFLNQDILFTAALLLRCCYISAENSSEVVRGTDIIGFHLRAFGSLFNHSCDPNVTFCPTKSCQDIYFARYPIKKGSQLFLAYNRNTFLNQAKKYRQEDLQDICNFTCDCIACKENWSDICLPSLKVVLKIIPSLRTSILTDILKIDLEKIESSSASVSLKRELILLYLKLLSKHFTVYCQEYFSFLEYLTGMYSSLEFH